MTFSFGEMSNGGIFDRRYFPSVVDAVNSHLLLFHENESRERTGGRERKWLGANSFRAQNGNCSREDTYV